MTDNDGKTLQRGVDAENLNDFVSSITGGNADFSHFKNRYTNVLLYNQGAVILKKEQPTDGDYIHASRINTKWGSWILTQAPKERTIIDVYRMIWQQRIHTVAVVVDMDKEFAPFFDVRPGKKMKTKGRFTVRTIAVRPEGKSIVTYELKLLNQTEKVDEKERTLNVVALLGWKEDRPYEAKTIIKAIHNVQALSKSMEIHVAKAKECPMLIIGNSGCRRTGVFALSCIYNSQLSVERGISFLATIDYVRNLRYGVLNKKSMFLLLVEVVVGLAAETGAITPGSADHKQLIELLRKEMEKRNAPPSSDNKENEGEEEEENEKKKDEPGKKGGNRKDEPSKKGGSGMSKEGRKNAMKAKDLSKKSGAKKKEAKGGKPPSDTPSD